MFSLTALLRIHCMSAEHYGNWQNPELQKYQNEHEVGLFFVLNFEDIGETFAPLILLIQNVPKRVSSFAFPIEKRTGLL